MERSYSIHGKSHPHKSADVVIMVIYMCYIYQRPSVGIKMLGQLPSSNQTNLAGQQQLKTFQMRKVQMTDSQRRLSSLNHNASNNARWRCTMRRTKWPIHVSIMDMFLKQAEAAATFLSGLVFDSITQWKKTMQLAINLVSVCFTTAKTTLLWVTDSSS